MAEPFRDGFDRSFLARWRIRVYSRAGGPELTEIISTAFAEASHAMPQGGDKVRESLEKALETSENQQTQYWIRTALQHREAEEHPEIRR